MIQPLPTDIARVQTNAALSIAFNGVSNLRPLALVELINQPLRWLGGGNQIQAAVIELIFPVRAFIHGIREQLLHRREGKIHRQNAVPVVIQIDRQAGGDDSLFLSAGRGRHKPAHAT
ncbi:hypothetical protein D3C85_1245410 [compost metagenome]